MDTSNLYDLAVIFNSVPSPVFVQDENLRFIFVNKAYEKMFHVQMKQILGKSIFEMDYISDAERLFYEREGADMLQSGKTRHHIFDYLYHGKKKHTCLYWSAGFAQKNGVRGLIGVIVNITRQTKMVHILRKKLQAGDSEKKEIARKNRVDPLTLAYTRKFFDETLQKLTASAGLKGLFACIMLDIDNLKRVNEAFGHITGDSVLRDVAAVLKACSRKHDMVYRYEGEAFAVLLLGGALGNATQLAERICRRVPELVQTPDGQSVTISAGYSEQHAGEAGTLVVQRADQARAAAKQAGGNCACMG
jgi:diguanylate cyclase (GGDEF)-like protein/PAS domain S-box-containing protein